MRGPLRTLIIAALCACSIGVLMPASATAAPPKNPKLASVHTFAFGLGDGMLSGNIASRFAGYDLVVVDGEGATRAQIAALHAHGTLVIAYLDVGTIERGRWWYRRAKPYRMELWGDWGEWYARTSAPGYRNLIAGKVAPKMLAKGFDGLFLDNTDMVEAHRRQAAGMRRLVRRLGGLVHARGGVLFAQNGDESVAAIAPWLDGWNREDVTSTYDFDSGSYRRVSAADHRGAQVALRRWAAAGLLVTSADYTRSPTSAVARAAVRESCAAGAIPFVSNIWLTRMPPAVANC